MQFRRYLFIVIISLGLQACASTKSYQNLQQGKSTFESGDYQQAFRQLLPLAANGNAEAEYAIGYMYYYGYGVPEDSQTGLFWINKAAEQHYPPAIKAAVILRKNVHTPEHQFQTNNPEYLRIKTSENNANPILQPTAPREPDELLQALPQRIAAVETTPPLINKQEPTQPIASTQKPEAMPGYTLQLFGSFDLNSAKHLQTALGIEDKSYIRHTTHQGKDWYVLTMGQYKTAHLAIVAKNNLATELTKFSPWVRASDTLEMV